MLLLATAAYAAPSTPAELMARVERHLQHVEQSEGPDGCLTPLVAELKQRADELTPAQRRWATAALMPWKHDLLDTPIPLRAGPPPPDAPPTEPCFSVGENRITSAHFAVEWDNGTTTESTAERFITWLEEGYTAEVEDLGWEPPLQGDNYLMLAYIEPGNYQAAYTTVDYCGAGLVPYIVAQAGSFSNSSWAETMAVHEFNHALQFGYGFAWEFWWWEATATYIESQVYPGNNWWAYYVQGYSDNPQLAFNASNQNDQDIFWHMYGMAIWAKYIDEYAGGHETVLDTWRAAVGERGTYTFGMIDAFEELGLDFNAAYADFIVKNTVMAYDAQRQLPDVDERDTVDELPADDEVDGRSRPEGYGQIYTRFDSDAGEGDLHITFDGDDDVAWSVQLVEVSRDEVLRVVAADVVDGQGELTLEGFGDEDAVLVVSPLEDGDSLHGYSWTAEIVEPVADEPVDDTPGADDTETPAGCGCASGAAGFGVPGFGVLLALATLARRRR